MLEACREFSCFQIALLLWQHLLVSNLLLFIAGMLYRDYISENLKRSISKSNALEFPKERYRRISPSVHALSSIWEQGVCHRPCSRWNMLHFQRAAECLTKVPLSFVSTATILEIAIGKGEAFCPTQFRSFLMCAGLNEFSQTVFPELLGDLDTVEKLMEGDNPGLHTLLCPDTTEAQYGVITCTQCVGEILNVYFRCMGCEHHFNVFCALCPKCYLEKKNESCSVLADVSDHSLGRVLNHNPGNGKHRAPKGKLYQIQYRFSREKKDFVRMQEICGQASRAWPSICQQHHFNKHNQHED